MNDYIEYFTNYVMKNYDINDSLIEKKYYHSLRVAKLMMILAKRMNLNEEDILLAFKLGLCHDIGRFHEAKINGVYNNRVYDHGAYSNKVLYNDLFIRYMDIDNHLLFRKAIYCHNKKDLCKNLDKQESFFANMLRDTDKIDLLDQRTQGTELKFFDNPSKAILANYLNNQTIDINNMHNSSDSIVLYLSFMKDLVFDESFEILLQNDIINRFQNIINVSEEKEILFNEIISKLNERRGKVYVR